MSISDDIYKKELFVMIVAVKRAPSYINLRMFVDNTTCIFGVLKHGQTDN